MTVHQPHELWRSAEVEAKKLGVAEFVNGTARKRLHQKWCAARFGMGFATNTGPCEIEIEDYDDQERYRLGVHGKARTYDPRIDHADFLRGRVAPQNAIRVFTTTLWHKVLAISTSTRLGALQKALNEDTDRGK